MKRCIIVNPKSGSLKALDIPFFQQLDRLEPAEMHVTTGPGSAEFYARAAAAAGDCDEIIAAGGDGTLNEVVNGMAGHFDRVRLGIIPLGTGNDFVRSLGLPLSLKDNIDLLLAGEVERIDAVRAQSDQCRYFLNVSAGGFSGLVDEQLTPEVKKTWGPLSYLRGAAGALPNLRAYETVVDVDGEQLDFELYNVVVANGRYVAGGLPIAPEADLRDGLLDVILIASRPALDVMLVAAQVLLGKHVDNEAVIHRRGARVRVQSQPGMWFNVDGELIGNEPIVFEVLPRALQVVGNKTS